MTTTRICAARDCDEVFQVSLRQTVGLQAKRFCSYRCRRRERDRVLYGHRPQAWRKRATVERKARAKAEREARARLRREWFFLLSLLRGLNDLEDHSQARCPCPACKRARRLWKSWYVTYRKGHVCTQCGGRFGTADLHFHHRDPSTKAFRMSAARAEARSVAEIDAEILKCDVLCADCHEAAHQD